MKVYIGMDVHGKSIYSVLQNESGKVIREMVIPTDPEHIKTYLMEAIPGGIPKGTRIGMESGQQATWLSKYLSSLGMSPVVIDAREVRVKSSRPNQKSDRRDAFEICDGLRRGIYRSIVYIPDEQIQRLKNILMRRRHFVSLCTCERNAAKYLLRANGLSTTNLCTESAKGWDKMKARAGDTGFAEHIGLHNEVWKLAADKVDSLEKELDAALKPFEGIMEVLTSAPGVGRIVAATYLAVIGTPERFPDSSRVVSYAGLVTSTFDSGETERHGHITKRGSSELRAMLCEAAQHARNAHNPLNPYFVRICAKKGYKKAIIAVAHRLARMLYQMWRHMEMFDIDKTNLEFGEFRKVKTAYYKIKA